MAPFGCRIIGGRPGLSGGDVAVEPLHLGCVFGYSAVARARRAARFLTAVVAAATSVSMAAVRDALVVGALAAVAVVVVFVSADLTGVGRVVVAVLAAARVRGPVVPAAFGVAVARG